MAETKSTKPLRQERAWLHFTMTRPMWLAGGQRVRQVVKGDKAGRVWNLKDQWQVSDCIKCMGNPPEGLYRE